jgi:hypothetical protein
MQGCSPAGCQLHLLITSTLRSRNRCILALLSRLRVASRPGRSTACESPAGAWASHALKPAGARACQVQRREVVHVGDFQRLKQGRQPLVAETQRLACAARLTSAAPAPRRGCERLSVSPAPCCCPGIEAGCCLPLCRITYTTANFTSTPMTRTTASSLLLTASPIWHTADRHHPLCRASH